MDESFEVIFQLHSPVTDADLAYFSKMGATHLHEAKLIDGGLIEAPADVLRKLSNWERVEYLELNRELEFFYLPPDWGGIRHPSLMMHETTHVVRATDAWHRAIIDVNGNVQFETDNAFTEWEEMVTLLSTSILVSMRVTQTSITSNLGLVRKSSTLQNGMVFGQKPETPTHPLDTDTRRWNHCRKR